MSELEQTDCPSCFVLFAVPARLLSARRRDGKGFYCPNGHSMSFRDCENDRTRRERDRLKQEAAQRDDEIAALRREWSAAESRAKAAERKTKRVEKRAHAGLCPCCNRSFAELARHIASKHPEFRAEDAARENVVSLVKARYA